MSNFNLETITLERNGKTYTAQYKVESGLITVYSPFGNKTTQVGSLPKDELARMLLSELINQNSN